MVIRRPFYVLINVISGTMQQCCRVAQIFFIGIIILMKLHIDIAGAPNFFCNLDLAGSSCFWKRLGGGTLNRKLRQPNLINRRMCIGAFAIKSKR